MYTHILLEVNWSLNKNPIKIRFLNIFSFLLYNQTYH